MNLDDAPERSASAGEYVLGTLDAGERAEFDAALRGDTALLAEVYAWQDRLLGLARRVAPVEVHGGAWAAIEARLGANPPLPAVTPAANDPLWQRVRRWQWTSAGALAAALLLAVLLVVRGPAAPPAGAHYLAVLQSPTDKANGWIVDATAGGELRLVPVAAAAAVPAGKVLQFWTKAEGAAGPTSLGLVTAGVATRLPVSRLPTLGERQLFELTLEPEGGSPIGRPTGPVLYLGRSVAM